jgi:uncharacterized protein (TIGR03066 family)
MRMSTPRLLTTAVTVLALGVLGRADDKADKTDKPDYAKLLVGSWEATKTMPDALPVGTVADFDKEGKLRITHDRDGMKNTIEYAYKVEGDKVILDGKFDGVAVRHTITIKKINATEMVTEDEKGKVVEFKRKK